jgi:hypothetical protein
MSVAYGPRIVQEAPVMRGDRSPLALAIVTVLIIAAVSWQDSRTIRSALSERATAAH